MSAPVIDLQTPVVADLETHAAFDPSLNRKAMTATVLAGYFDVAPVLRKIIAPNGQLAIPKAYRKGGRVSDDGFEFNTEIKMTEQRGMGSSAVLRRDIMSKDFTAEWSFLETHKLAYEMVNGLDLRALKMTADGEFRIVHPTNLSTVYWRTLIIGRDGMGPTLTYMIKYYPRSTMTAKSKEQWQDKTEGLPRAVTIGADQDPDLQTACVEYLAGPGALAKAAAMGIEVEAAA